MDESSASPSVTPSLHNGRRPHRLKRSRPVRDGSKYPRFPGESRGPRPGGTSGGDMVLGFPHGSNPWAEGPRVSAPFRFHALRAGDAAEFSSVPSCPPAARHRLRGHAESRNRRAPVAHVFGHRTVESGERPPPPSGDRRRSHRAALPDRAAPKAPSNRPDRRTSPSAVGAPPPSRPRVPPPGPLRRRRARHARRRSLPASEAMTDRGDAEFFQILGGKARQQFGTDVVLFEGGCVLLEAQRAQPFDNVHRRLPRQQRAG
jgi:hypothetical protein